MGSKFTWGSAILLAASVVSTGCSQTNLWPTVTLPSISFDQSSAPTAAGRSDAEAGRSDRRSESSSKRPVDGKFATARLAEKRGHSERATQIYLELVRDDPSNSLVFHRLGVLSASEGRFGKAHDYFARARKLSPNDPKLLSDIGYAYYMQHRLDESETLLRKALTIKPNHVSATNNLALVLGEQGQFAESLAMFKKVNDKADAHSNMAYVYTQVGQLDKAEQEYGKALSLNPKLRSSAEAMIQVASKRKQVEHYQAIAAAKQKSKAKNKIEVDTEGLKSQGLEEEEVLAEKRPERKPAASRKVIARSRVNKKMRDPEGDQARLVSAEEEIVEVVEIEENDEFEEVTPQKSRPTENRAVVESSEADRAWANLARSIGSGTTRTRTRVRPSTARSQVLRQPEVQQASGHELREKKFAEEDQATEGENIRLTSFREDDAPAPPSGLKPMSTKTPAQSRQQAPRRPVPVNELREHLPPLDALRSSDVSDSSGIPAARLRRADESLSTSQDRISLGAQGARSASTLNQLRLK